MSKDSIVDFIAGSLGAIVGVYIGKPLDTLKVKMQAFPHLYPNLVTCCKETWNKEGVVRGLYAGTVPSLVGNVAENSVLFAAYGICQNLVAKKVGRCKVDELTIFHNGTAGFMAAFWSSIVLCPTELVKCKLQTMREVSSLKGLPPPNLGPFLMTKHILKQNGVPGLFVGLTATFMREMPGYFAFFYSYELSREMMRPLGKTKEEIGSAKTILAGGIAGMTLWILVFPVDVIKSRLQISGFNTSMYRMMADIARNEGIFALYNGLLPTLIRTFPSTGVLFLTYEYSKKWINSLS
ncbi:SLC25A2_15 [Lepeophtheirus salmonis]|uniref:SLC25A2_15 n=1 Tax=Lepeophtheirus salmonis TaxID=72036 RepID=A0A7R8H456_LEPSM|nr:SLC25A2_15 [Lepeophtheirus salmonis]CAF2857859.1 SLC25A2_15 [Lepeophtheirus salmonis]